MKRGSVTKSKSKLVAVWVPTEMAAAIDQAVIDQDTDRSKFIRRALANQFAAVGVKPKLERAA